MYFNGNLQNSAHTTKRLEHSLEISQNSCPITTYTLLLLIMLPTTVIKKLIAYLIKWLRFRCLKMKKHGLFTIIPML